MMIGVKGFATWYSTIGMKVINPKTRNSSMSDDYDKSIHSNPDALAWAKFYKETFPNADEELMHTWFANAMMAMSDHKDNKRDKDLRPSEAVFAFSAWLTTREDEITVGSTSDCAPLVGLITKFLESQGLEDPRDDYTCRVKEYPKD